MDLNELPKNIRTKNTRITLGVVAVFVVVAIGQTLWQTPSAVVSKISEKLDLAGAWDVCVLPDGEISSAAGSLTYQGRSLDGACTWSQQNVPATVPAESLFSDRGWIVYRTHFEAPTFCTETETCSFIASEVGDASLTALNGHGIATHGGLPPHEQYARHYPLQAEIPAVLLRQNGPNELAVVVRYMKKVQAGILRGPVAIVSTPDAFAINRRTLLQNVIIPLMSAVGFGIMALLGLLALTVGGETNKKTGAYLRYCVASALFLTSYTSLPREVLSLSVTGCLHFLLRFMMDWTFFELALTLTDWREDLRKWIRPLYVVAISVFAIQYLMEPMFPIAFKDWSGFSGAVKWSRMIDYLLLFGAYLYGAVGAIMTKKRVGNALVLTFSLAAVMAFTGCLTFHGVTSLPYFIQIYPFFVALIVGIEIGLETVTEAERLKRDAIVGLVTRKIVHNLKTPIASMWRYLEITPEIPSERARLMKELCGRMGDMVNTIIPNAQALLDQAAGEGRPAPESATQGPSLSHLSSLLEIVVSQKRNLIGVSPEIDLSTADGFATFAMVNPIEFKQVLTNILDNAVDAVEKRLDGWVELWLGERDGNVVIAIWDNGCGISAENIKRVGTQGFTTKANGNGLGLHHSREIIRSWGGKLSISSTEGSGTKMEITFPKAPTPEWIATEVRVASASRCIVLDDDPGVRELWEERLTEFGLSCVSFRSAEAARKWLRSAELNPSDVLLFDHEIHGESLKGLDILADVPIKDRAYLVTSYFDDLTVIEGCKKLGVKLIPKSAINLVSVNVVSEGESESPGLRVALSAALAKESVSLDD